MRFHFKGLTSKEVLKSRAQFGTNELPPAATETFWEKLKDQFKDPLIRILCVGLAVIMLLAAFGYAEFVEGVGIAVAVVIATFVATLADWKNEASFQALQHEASQVESRVYRDAQLETIAIGEIVVGDRVLLQPGDKVPADGRVLVGAVDVNQAVLTGEAMAVRKEGRRAAHAVATEREVRGGRGRGLSGVGSGDAAAAAATTATATVDSDTDGGGDDDDDVSSMSASATGGNDGGGDGPYADKHRVFRGTVVEDGECVMQVEVVGTATSYGVLADELAAAEDEGRQSPLQHKLAHLADVISWLGYGGALLIAIAFIFKQFVMDNGYRWVAIKAYVSHWQVALHDVANAGILAVIIIVVAVPEGLPMMIATVLSLNMRKLLRANVLVRRLLGIETAGSMSVLLCDKTGTITRGDFAPSFFMLADGQSFAAYADVPAPLRTALRLALLEASSAQVSEVDGSVVGGNASDRALVRFVTLHETTLGGGYDNGASVETVREILFSSDRKYAAAEVNVSASLARALPACVVARPLSQTPSTVIAKGAPEVIAARCATYVDALGQVQPLQRDAFDAASRRASAGGVRLVAVALAVGPLAHERKQLPTQMTLLGAVGILDELRPDARDAVTACVAAGIHVVLVTGDRKETADAVAADIGLLRSARVGGGGVAARDGGSRRKKRSGGGGGCGGGGGGGGTDSANQSLLAAADDDGDDDDDDDEAGVAALDASGPLSLTSSELDALDDVDVADLLPALAVVSRARPSDKSRLVRLAQERGLVVGMTGDGVNDSAALKKADVGFAMGAGAEMAKEAADIVILDNTVASIARAVLYGRTIFASIRKFVVFQSTVNVSSGLIVFLGPFLGFDFPLSLVQLLWVNLVMDTLAALAFGGEPALRDYMLAAPVPRNAPIVTRRMLSQIFTSGIASAALSIAFLLSDSARDLFVRNGARSEPAFLTAFFCLFIFTQTANAFSVRTPDHFSPFKHLLGNKGFLITQAVVVVVQIAFASIGGDFLRTVPLESSEWAWVCGLSLLILPVDWLRKLLVAVYANCASSSSSRRRRSTPLGRSAAAVVHRVRRLQKKQLKKLKMKMASKKEKKMELISKRD